MLYKVMLEGTGKEDIKTIKAIRKATGCGLYEAKELFENAPRRVKAGLSKEQAEELKAILENLGNKAVIYEDNTIPENKTQEKNPLKFLRVLYLIATAVCFFAAAVNWLNSDIFSTICNIALGIVMFILAMVYKSK